VDGALLRRLGLLGVAGGVDCPKLNMLLVEEVLGVGKLNPVEEGVPNTELVEIVVELLWLLFPNGRRGEAKVDVLGFVMVAELNPPILVGLLLLPKLKGDDGAVVELGFVFPKLNAILPAGDGVLLLLALNPILADGLVDVLVFWPNENIGLLMGSVEVVV